jgi:hypothetical protein
VRRGLRRKDYFVAKAKSNRFLSALVVQDVPSKLIAEAVVAGIRRQSENLSRMCHSHSNSSEGVKEENLARRSARFASSTDDRRLVAASAPLVNGVPTPEGDVSAVLPGIAALGLVTIWRFVLA